MYVRSLTGTEGGITFPTLGAHVATFKSWQLTRHEDNGAHAGPFVLRAVMSYMNPLLWDQPYRRQVKICLGKKCYTLEQNANAKTEVIGTSQLIMEGVTLCPVP